MKHKIFEEIMEHRLNFCKILLTKKSKEYSTDDDKLHNFKRAGELQRCSPEKALIGMLTKQFVSILDMVDKIEKGKNIGEELLEEKITDNINYLLLLEALIREREGYL